MRLYYEDHSYQLNKHGHDHCGDVITVVRFPESTLAVLADGMGSGITANVSATLVTEYLVELVRNSVPTAEAVHASLKALHIARLGDGPWAAVTVIDASSEGEVTIYCYESPLPLLVSASGIEQLSWKPQFWEGEVVNEASTHLRPGECILAVSDGITQAGLGKGFPRGWGENGFTRYLKDEGLAKPDVCRGVPQALARRASHICGHKPTDDISALVLRAREPRALHVLSGPPVNHAETERIMLAFLNEAGRKAVCGGTTTAILAKTLGVSPKVHKGEFGAPAYYELPGIDFASEGAITLNRLNNIWDEPDLALEAGYGPSRLLELMLEANEVHFWVGQAVNVAHASTLKPAGVLTRNEVVKALQEKLERAGKLVTVRQF